MSLVFNGMRIDDADAELEAVSPQSDEFIGACGIEIYDVDRASILPRACIDGPNRSVVLGRLRSVPRAIDECRSGAFDASCEQMRSIDWIK